MKIVLTIVAVLVLAVLAVVGIGAMLPKRHVATRSASFRATPEALFALISGPQEWRPDVQRSEMVPDAGGKVLMRESSKDGGTMLYEVVESTPPRSLTRRIATPNLPFSGSWTYTLEPRDGGTVVRITEDAEVYNPVFRFMSRFVMGQTKTMDAYLRALGKATGQEIVIGD
jgi:Polyketide cyclase / dehydrase and lipid transport